jgi:hypothetical protein
VRLGCIALPRNASLRSQSSESFSFFEDLVGLERLLICQLKVRFLRGSPHFTKDLAALAAIICTAFDTSGMRTYASSQRATAARLPAGTIQYKDSHQAAKPEDWRNRPIDSRKAAIWFQLGMLRDASHRQGLQGAPSSPLFQGVICPVQRGGESTYLGSSQFGYSRRVRGSRIERLTDVCWAPD